MCVENTEIAKREASLRRRAKARIARDGLRKFARDCGVPVTTLLRLVEDRPKPVDDLAKLEIALRPKKGACP
jgi:hypothetical protein